MTDRLNSKMHKLNELEWGEDMSYLEYGGEQALFVRYSERRKLCFSLVCISFYLLLSLTSFSHAADDFLPVTDNMLYKPADKNWLSYRGNLAGWGYSSLSQIDSSNVNNLSLAWSVAMEVGTNEVTPIVYQGILYLGNPGNIIRAMDASNGDLLWEYRRQLPPDTLASTSRNMAIYEDKLLIATQDAYVIALNARNGKLMWETKVGDYKNMIHTSGPIAAKGKVFSGRSCMPDMSGGCFISAHDVDSGKELWRRYVIPRPGEPGDETWGGLPLEDRTHVGAWGTGTYDPELNLLYWGTSNPTPSPEVSRGTVNQDLLYTNSTLALDADTGAIVWYFQHLPRPNWDLDHVFQRILVDAGLQLDSDAPWVQNPAIQMGKKRKLMTGIPGKTGIVWTLDRSTGEFLWARETVEQNVIQAIDAISGKVTVNEAVIPDHINDQYGLVCPSAYGGKNWMTGAYSPKINTLYMPINNTCMEPFINEEDPASHESYGITLNPIVTPGAKGLGRLEAISVETAETLWKFEQRAGMSSVVATAGNLIFAGDFNRRFRAFDAMTGDILWETVLNAPVTGHPVSFSVEGTQYIAVAAGGGDRVSGVLNSLVDLSPQAGTNMLYVFALPGKPGSNVSNATYIRMLSKNKSKPSNKKITESPQFTQEQVQRGEVAYINHCASCHGLHLKGGIGPGLKGAGFFERWRGRSGLQLFNRIQASMPLGAPGSLSHQTVADILSYMYANYGYSVGDKPLLHEPEVLATVPAALNGGANDLPLNRVQVK